MEYNYREAVKEDADEHAEMLIAHRGEDGVPNSITELADDANKIEQMYYDLYQKILCVIEF